jgi:tRNA dimethylallyltransferase
MKTLVVLTGPTGVGKTELSLRLAEALGSPILSCDSRQVFKEMCIGTASPTTDQLARVQHYFIASKSIHEPYSAAKFEVDVLELLDELFRDRETILMTGGSMLYIDAVCKGIDDMPDVDPSIRAELSERYLTKGLKPILEELQQLDPLYYEQVDRQNYKRVLHGLEMCRMTGLPFSSFRKDTAKVRPFRILKLCLQRDRQELYDRVDRRVDEMMRQGLEQEARDLYPHRALNALNTVGYKEMFDYFDGKTDRAQAVSALKFNTHKYVRKQLTWFRRDADYRWFHPDDWDGIRSYLEQNGIRL